MPQCIAAVFTAAVRLLQALCSPPKGRHSARRRRSTRVRRYAPMTPAAPAPLPSHPAARSPWLEPQADDVAPRPKLRPPSAETNADDIALVRPYYRAHEAEADKAQARAALRLRAWGADLDFGFGPASDGTPAYTLDDYADRFPATAPRVPAPRLPARMDDLPHLSRVRARQQQRRTEQAAALAGVGV